MPGQANGSMRIFPEECIISTGELTKELISLISLMGGGCHPTCEGLNKTKKKKKKNQENGSSDSMPNEAINLHVAGAPGSQVT